MRKKHLQGQVRAPRLQAQKLRQPCLLWGSLRHMGARMPQSCRPAQMLVRIGAPFARVHEGTHSYVPRCTAGLTAAIWSIWSQ